MKNYPTQFIILSLFASLISCSKSSNNNPNPSTKPDSLFSWHQVEHATGQQISDIGFTSSSTGYYASSDGNIYQSLDSGKAWSKVPNSVSRGALNFFFVNSQYGFAQGGSQMQVTKDGGDTWEIKSLATSSAFSLFFVSPSTGYYSDIYAGVYKTSDTGNNWIQVYHSITSAQGYYSYFLNPNKGFVFSGDGNLYKTEDGSATWQQVASNVADNNNKLHFNTLLFLDSINGYYGTEAGL